MYVDQLPLSYVGSFLALGLAHIFQHLLLCHVESRKVLNFGPFIFKILVNDGANDCPCRSKFVLDDLTLGDVVHKKTNTSTSTLS